MHHAAEITFYDELGVAPDASQEEIRDSFRALVRILHPDHQTDQQLKEIAERQMRKLNRIYAVLSDPDKRRRYNETLEGEKLGPTIILRPGSDVNVRRLMERVAWVTAFLFVALALIWLSSDNPAAPPPAERAVRKAPSPALSSGASDTSRARLESELRLLKMERDAALQELTRLRAASLSRKAGLTAEPPAASSLPSPTTLTELPSATMAPSVTAYGLTSPQPATAPVGLSSVRPPAQKPANSSAARPFAGFWFYSRPPSSSHTKASSLYPPEFIETTITEQNGVIRGRYRSRYRIADRAISPNVNFEFTGVANGATLACSWTGPGGAKGEITLKLAGENGMTVDWTTTELGSTQGLVSGIATLTRRID